MYGVPSLMLPWHSAGIVNANDNATFQDAKKASALVHCLRRWLTPSNPRHHRYWLRCTALQMENAIAPLSLTVIMVLLHHPQPSTP